jgi:hypothetical protein
MDFNWKGKFGIELVSCENLLLNEVGQLKRELMQ